MTEHVSTTVEVEHQTENTAEPKERTWVDEIEVAGNQLVDRIKALYQEGNARRVIIRHSDGHELMSLPLSVGVIAGGLVTLANIGFAAVIAAVGAIAALVSKVKLEIIRSEPIEQAMPEPPVETQD